MITETSYSADLADIKELEKTLSDQMITMINHPVGNLYYEEWELNDEFKGTPLEKVYNSLPIKKGYSLLITIKPSSTFNKHCDPDDRWILNINGEEAYVNDLDNKVMNKIDVNGKWYQINGGVFHASSNFGNSPRTFLVVRSMLTRGDLKDRVKVHIKITDMGKDHKYKLENNLHPWIYQANKNGLLDNYLTFEQDFLEFETEREFVPKIQEMLNDPLFEITVT